MGIELIFSVCVLFYFYFKYTSEKEYEENYQRRFEERVRLQDDFRDKYVDADVAIRIKNDSCMKYWSDFDKYFEPVRLSFIDAGLGEMLTQSFKDKVRDFKDPDWSLFCNKWMMLFEIASLGKIPPIDCRGMETASKYSIYRKEIWRVHLCVMKRLDLLWREFNTGPLLFKNSRTKEIIPVSEMEYNGETIHGEYGWEVFLSSW